MPSLKDYQMKTLSALFVSALGSLLFAASLSNPVNETLMYEFKKEGKCYTLYKAGTKVKRFDVGFAPDLVELNGNAFFSYDDGVHGYELWSSDGTPEGTAVVTDIVPGLGSSKPAELTAFEGKLYFRAFTPEKGFELWSSDGSEEGTQLVADLEPEAKSSLPNMLEVSGNRLNFRAGKAHRGIYALESDGTLKGVEISYLLD